MHTLLQKQLEQIFKDRIPESPEFQELIRLVDSSYHNMQPDEVKVSDLTQTGMVQEQAMYRLFFESAIDILYYTDAKGNFTFVNEIATQITGFSTAELLQMNYLDLVLPDYRLEVSHFYRLQVLRGKKSSYYEFPILTKSGKTSWIGQNVQLIDAGDKQKRMQAIARDITRLKNAQIEIENSMDFMHEIMEAIPNPMFVKNRKHEWILVNDAYIQLVGIPKQKIQGKTEFQFLDAEDANKYIELDENQFLEGNDVLREMNFVTPSGESKNLLVKKSIYKKNNEVFLIAVITDITAINDREKEILLFSKITDQISDLISVVDYQGKVIYSNESHAKSIGKSKEELIGASIVEIEKLFPDLNTWQQYFNIQREQGSSLIEGENIRSDGSTFPVEANVKYVNVENKEYIVATLRDITQRKKEQEKLKESEERLEEAQQIAKVGGWEIDVKERTIVWSKAMYEICETDQNLQPTLNETYALFTRVTREKIIQAFYDAIELNQEFEMEAQIKTGKGNLVDVKVRGIPQMKNGVAHNIRGIMQDISKEKENNRLMLQYTQELEKKNRELDQFAYVVSHDLKAPLRGINNLSLWIEEDLEGRIEKDTKKNLDLMRKRVSRLESLIDGILQYSRVGRTKYESSEFRLVDTLIELVQSMSPPANLKIKLQPDLPTLHTEKIAIEQIFSNYISNAIKHNHKTDPKIEITYKQNGDFYEFCVADNGPGIEKDYFDKIFVIFQTLHSRDTYENTGVGLAIVKKLVEDKGGKVWVESEKDKGSRFYFSWPVNDTHS